MELSRKNVGTKTVILVARLPNVSPPCMPVTRCAVGGGPLAFPHPWASITLTGNYMHKNVNVLSSTELHFKMVEIISFMLCIFYNY